MLELDNQLKYAKVFKSKNQFWVDKNSGFINDIETIIKVINKYSNIKFDWSQKEKTNILKNSDLSRIVDLVSNQAQNELVKILGKYIEPHIKLLFGNRLKYNIRVSAQIKGRWSAAKVNENRKGSWVNGIFYEDKILPNFCFPTRGHQDLDNNGNRSSHTLIFYFQLTEAFENSSILQFGNFENKVGLCEFNNNSGYSNEIPGTVLDNLTWTSQGVNPGEILLFSPFAIHRSTKVSEIPRVALNVKIQPTNLDYLSLVYGNNDEVYKTQLNFKNKLNKLYEILSEASKFNRILLFERAVTAFLQGNYDKSISLIKEMCLFKIKTIEAKKILIGAISRKITFMVTKEELDNFYKSKNKVVKLSCAESILNTIGSV